nr:MAG TPA: dUTPase [Caudoviricetes sp.]
MTKTELFLFLAVDLCFVIILVLSLHKKKVKIKYHDDEVSPIKNISVGDWIDLASNTEVKYKKGDTVVIDLGVAMELPHGFEAHLLPRSSTFQNTGLILTNSMGIIDNSYCGDNDYWCAKFYATRDGEIEKGQRLLQFRIVENQPTVLFSKVMHLGNADRGGYGSTGK